MSRWVERCGFCHVTLEPPYQGVRKNYKGDDLPEVILACERCRALVKEASGGAVIDDIDEGEAWKNR